MSEEGISLRGRAEYRGRISNVIVLLTGIQQDLENESSLDPDTVSKINEACDRLREVIDEVDPSEDWEL